MNSYFSLESVIIEFLIEKRFTNISIILLFINIFVSVIEEIQYLKDLGFLNDSIINDIIQYRELATKSLGVIENELNELKDFVFQTISKSFIPIHDLRSSYAINKSNSVMDIINNKNNLDILNDLSINKEEVYICKNIDLFI